MHCPRCGYLLFNLTRANCPECGEVYDVERYRFAPGSVSFCCPECGRPYYGNDPQGLPVPRAFDCAGCGRPIHLNRMRVVPLRPEAVGWAGSPWDNRERIGLWRAWWDSMVAVLLRPSEFFRTHAGTSTREALIFAAVSIYVGLGPALLVSFAISAAVGSILTAAPLPGGGAPMPAIPMAAVVLLYIAVFFLLPPFLLFVMSAIWAVATHVALAVVAPRRRPIGFTYRTVLYSFATAALNAIPVCGSNISFVWQIVSLINGIKEVHHTTGGRATLAVLWLPAAVLLGYLLFFVVLFTVLLDQ